MMNTNIRAIPKKIKIDQKMLSRGYT